MLKEIAPAAEVSFGKEILKRLVNLLSEALKIDLSEMIKCSEPSKVPLKLNCGFFSGGFNRDFVNFIWRVYFF